MWQRWTWQGKQIRTAVVEGKHALVSRTDVQELLYLENEHNSQRLSSDDSILAT
jgi:hypothetical protein